MTVVMLLGMKTPVKAYTVGNLRWSDGAYRLFSSDGNMVKNDFVFDGTYTYYAQADGTPMKDRLTYHPDGEHIIYFDEYGHEVFSNFQYCSSVGYTCYFDSQGYIYKNQITFVDDKVFYLNANGKMEDSGWFQFANGMDYGFANADGTLKINQFEYDNDEKVVYYHWNGMVARGLISDGFWYYHMDEKDGHYLGRFKSSGVAASNTYELQVLDLVNEERLNRNIAPLMLNLQVQQAAEVRAEELVIKFDHTRPDGRSCFTALDEYVDSYCRAGENIAAGYETPQSVMNGWMNSSGHKANILNKNFTEMGVGYYYNDSSTYGAYWVQMFIADWN